MEGGRKIVDKQKHELLMRLGQAVSDQVVQGMQSNHLLILNPDRFIPLFNCYRELAEGPHADQVDQLIADQLNTDRVKSGQSSLVASLLKQVQASGEKVDEKGEADSSVDQPDSRLAKHASQLADGIDASHWPNMADFERQQKSLTADHGSDLADDGIDYSKETVHGSSPINLPHLNDASGVPVMPNSGQTVDSHVMTPASSQGLASSQPSLAQAAQVLSAQDSGNDADHEADESQASQSVQGEAQSVESSESVMSDDTQEPETSDSAERDDDSVLKTVLAQGDIPEESSSNLFPTEGEHLSAQDLADSGITDSDAGSDVPSHQMTDAPRNSGSGSVFAKSGDDEIVKPDLSHINGSGIVDSTITNWRSDHPVVETDNEDDRGNLSQSNAQSEVDDVDTTKLSASSDSVGSNDGNPLAIVKTVDEALDDDHHDDQNDLDSHQGTMTTMPPLSDLATDDSGSTGSDDNDDDSNNDPLNF